MLCAASSQPSSLGGCSCDKTCGFPRTLPLPVLVWPLCFPCMFTLSCPARARMPGIVSLPCPAFSCSACLASSLPLTCSFLCYVARAFYFQKISFLFVLPFCRSTKWLGPFVLPQKGRTVPSLLLSSLPQIFGSLEPPAGAIFGERVSSAFGYGGGVGQRRFQNLWQLYWRGFLGGSGASQATARVGPTVLPVVNTDRVIAFVVSGQNGMLRRRILSSDSPGPLLDFSSACSSSSTLGLAPL